MNNNNNKFNSDMGSVNTGREVQAPYHTNFSSPKNKESEKKLNKEGEDKKLDSLSTDTNNIDINKKGKIDNYYRFSLTEDTSEVGDETLLMSQFGKQNKVEKEDEDKDLKRELNEARNRISELEKQNKIFMEALGRDLESNLISSIEFMRQKMVSLYYSSLEKENKNLKTKLDKAREELSEFAAKLADKENEAECKGTLIQNLLKEQDKSTTENKELKIKLDEAKEQIVILTQALSKAYKEARDLLLQKQNVEMENTRFKSGLMPKQGEMLNRMMELEKELSRYQQQEKFLLCSTFSHNEDNKKLKIELDEAQKQIVNLKKEIQDLKNGTSNFENKVPFNKQKEKIGKIDNPRPNSCDKVSVLSRIKSIYDRIKNEPNSETNIHLKEKEDK